MTDFFSLSKMQIKIEKNLRKKFLKYNHKLKKFSFAFCNLQFKRIFCNLQVSIIRPLVIQIPNMVYIGEFGNTIFKLDYPLRFV